MSTCKSPTVSDQTIPAEPAAEETTVIVAPETRLAPAPEQKPRKRKRAADGAVFDDALLKLRQT